MGENAKAPRQIDVDCVQYECLPKFCFHCGIIIHVKVGCPNRSKMHHHENPIEYGSWLLALLPTHRQDGWRKTIGMDRGIKV
jgi:hypothetical protein